MDKQVTFAELGKGDTFDFISGQNDSFYHRCRKISARRYEWTERAGTFKGEVGTKHVKVYHVELSAS